LSVDREDRKIWDRKMGLGDGGVSASDVGAAPLGAGLIFLSVNFPVASFQHDRSARIPPTFLMHALRRSEHDVTLEFPTAVA
jgi:hypothetical protein